MFKDRAQRTFAIVFALTLAPLVYTVFDTNDGDVPLYHRIASEIFAGRVPYRDFEFEYPPYVLPWFALAGLAPGYESFRIVFSLELLALDIAVKLVLVREGARIAGEARRYFPFYVYAAGTLLQSYFYLKRVDVIPAATTVFAVLALSRGRYAAAGVFVALGAGAKLYPALIAPMLLVAAARAGGSRAAVRFVLGGVAAILPLALLALWVPWWKFAAFHAGRGLQVESVYASVLWLLHFGGLEAVWAGKRAWMDIEGPAAAALLPLARILFAAATLGSVFWSARAAWKSPSGHPSELGSKALLPIVAFICTNIVLSTQYMIWVIALGAIAFAHASRGVLISLGAAVVISLFVFPAPGYTTTGIDLLHSLLLVIRNVALVASAALLGREITRARRATPALGPG